MPSIDERNPIIEPAGSIIGFLSSILGIGGGTFSVPYFRSLGLKLTSAIGTSAACGHMLPMFQLLKLI